MVYIEWPSVTPGRVGGGLDFASGFFLDGDTWFWFNEWDPLEEKLSVLERTFQVNDYIQSSLHAFAWQRD